MFVEPNIIEGSPTLSNDRENLTANNHVEVAQQLKVRGHRYTVAPKCEMELHISFPFPLQ
jgi:hypothetical protein